MKGIQIITYSTCFMHRDLYYGVVLGVGLKKKIISKNYYNFFFPPQFHILCDLKHKTTRNGEILILEPPIPSKPI